MIKFMNRYHLDFWGSIISTLIMSLVSVLSFNETGYYFYLAMLFFYLVTVFIRAFNFVVRKLNDFDDKGKASYLNPMVTGISVIVETLVFSIALMAILLWQPVVQYTTSWLVYVYVGFALFKIVNSIVRIHQGKKHKNSVECALGGVSLSNGIFTTFIVLVNLNAMFDQPEVTNIIEFSTIGVLGLISLLYSVYLIVLAHSNYNRVKYTF